MPIAFPIMQTYLILNIAKYYEMETKRIFWLQSDLAINLASYGQYHHVYRVISDRSRTKFSNPPCVLRDRSHLTYKRTEQNVSFENSMGR